MFSIAVSIFPTHSFSFNRNRSLGLDAGEEIRSGFVGATFASSEFGLGGNEFTRKALARTASVSSSVRVVATAIRLSMASAQLQGRDAADDLALFLKGGAVAWGHVPFPRSKPVEHRLVPQRDFAHPQPLPNSRRNRIIGSIEDHSGNVLVCTGFCV